MTNPASTWQDDGQGGPVEKRLRSELPSENLSMSIAPRSPIGEGAFRIGWAQSESEATRKAVALAGWLNRQAWAEQAVARTPNVYVRLTTRALRDWIVEAWPNSSRRASSSARQCVRVKLVKEGGWAEGDLHAARAVSVAHAVASLLEWQSFQVETELCAPGMTSTGAQPLPHISVEWLRLENSEVRRTSLTRELPVSGVEVGYGPLRAKYGGALRTEDLIRDLAQRGAWQQLLNARHAESWATAALSFALLRSERARHVRMNDATLSAELRAFNLVHMALQPDQRASQAVTSEVSAPQDRRLRGLLLQLEGFTQVVTRSALDFEPAFVARYVRVLAAQVDAAARALSHEDSLWQVLRGTLAQGLELLGLGEALESESTLGRRLETRKGIHP